MSKPTVVIKFGGTSVATVNCIRKAAKIAQILSQDYCVVVVVSAMARFTNTLVEYTSYFYDVKDKVAYDTVLASGEQITVGLFVLALKELNLEAKSFLGWQVPIITDDCHANAHIKSIPAKSIMECLENNTIPVLAGFQGVTNEGEITTLGRGGSDTTAVALAIAINASECHIYTDVDGICAVDPNLVEDAPLINTIDFLPVIEMANSGAKVLHCRSVELAYKHGLPLWVKSSISGKLGTYITKGKQDIAIFSTGNQTMENPIINSIVTSKNEVMITIRNLPKSYLADLQVLNHLLNEGIVVDLVQREEHLQSTQIKFSIARDNLALANKTLNQITELIKPEDIDYNTEVAKVTIVGVGLQTCPSLLKKVFSVAIELKTEILLLSLTSLKVSFLLPEACMTKFVSSLQDELKNYYVS